VVGLSAAALFILMTANGIWFRKEHLSSDHKNEIIRTQEPERAIHLARSGTKGPKVMHSEKYDKINQEGLGIDHEKWKKEKEAYRAADGVSKPSN